MYLWFSMEKLSNFNQSERIHTIDSEMLYIYNNYYTRIF